MPITAHGGECSGLPAAAGGGARVRRVTASAVTASAAPTGLLPTGLSPIDLLTTGLLSIRPWPPGQRSDGVSGSRWCPAWRPPA
jgi:hypothetical protein